MLLLPGAFQTPPNWAQSIWTLKVAK